MSAPVSEPKSSRVVLTHPLGWIASGLGAGLSPRAPGTFGSLAALLPWFFWLRVQPPAIYLGVVALTFAIGVLAAQWVIDQTRIEDPSVVVCDEFIGQWLALFLAPAGWLWIAGGFALFRLFDIWKPWPVSWADNKLHGGFGAMFDDLLAGAYALIVLQAIHYLIP